MGEIDLYCERLGPGLLAEPFNALTNAAFVIAALLLWRIARRDHKLTPGVWLLVAFLALIGIASALFHTMADRVTQMLDVGSIGVFGLVYLWLHLRHMIGVGAPGAAAILGAFLAAGIFARQFTHVLNGSLSYLPILVGLLCLTVVHTIQARVRRYDLLVVVGLVAMSITLRTIDNEVCPQFPLGTHFAWHILNGILLFIAARALVDNLPAGVTQCHGAAAGT